MEQSVEILLVEDSDSDAKLTLRAFKKANIANSIIHLKDGAEALDYLFGKGIYEKRNITAKPKIILLDLNMPKIGGLEVLSIIKKDERTCSIPVVVMTSSKEDKDIIESYKLGVNSYVVKPVDFDNFSAAVTEVGFYWSVINQTAR